MSDIEREEFEQAVADKWSDSYKFTRFGDEDYYDEIVEGMWRGWQASREAVGPVEVWLGNGDKLIADIYADDGSYAGIGIFEPENGETAGIGFPDGSIDGQPLDKSNAVVLIRSTKPESLQVMVDELQEAMTRMGYTSHASADNQAVSVPEWIKCSDKMPKINSPVVVARISDNDGKPCLDSGVAALQPNNGWIGLGVFYRPKIDAGTIYQNDFSVMDVTHWMPLPKPPKQEKSQ